ncbi:MAG: hypothetical protein R3250_03880 [Melioribacteraceae bacterium]|nr:hypothetical protein [Melioribacteraceae bacterium]
MQNTLVFTIALNGYSQLFKNCIESQKKYCQKFDYKYSIVKKTPPPLSNTDSAWLKLYLIREALKMDFEWIAFIDADCQIRLHTPDFRQYVTNLNSKASIFMAQGFSGRINSGVILIKNTSSALNFLNLVLDNRYKEIPAEDEALYENGHVIHYGKDNPYVEIIPNRLWNNNIEFNKESYIQHYSGGILRSHYLKKHRIKALLHRYQKRFNFNNTDTVDWENKRPEILNEIITQNFS